MLKRLSSLLNLSDSVLIDPKNNQSVVHHKDLPIYKGKYLEYLNRKGVQYQMDYEDNKRGYIHHCPVELLTWDKRRKTDIKIDVRTLKIPLSLIPDFKMKIDNR